MGAFVESKRVRRMENRGGSCQPRRQAAHPSLRAMGVNDVVTGASQKAVEPEKATQIEEPDIVLHDADVPGAQNVRELLVDGEHVYLPAQLLCHPSQLENNDRAAAELGIANDVKQLHIHPRGMDINLAMPPARAIAAKPSQSPVKDPRRASNLTSRMVLVITVLQTTGGAQDHATV